MPKLKIHPLFLSLMVFLIMTGNFLLFLNMIVAVVLHELAHSRVARSRGYLIEEMILMPYGAVLTGKENINKSDAVAIYLAGPVFNALTALVFIALWWLIPFIYNFTKQFVAANLILCIFNLIPVYPLDGSKILMNITEKKLKTLFILKIIGIVISILMFLAFIITAFYKINFSIGIISLFLFAGAVVGNDKEKYHHMASNAPFVKNLSDGMKKDNIMIPSTMPLYKILKFIKPDTVNTFTIVDKKMKTLKIVTEDEMRQIFENNDITTQIGKIIEGDI